MMMMMMIPMMTNPEPTHNKRALKGHEERPEGRAEMKYTDKSFLQSIQNITLEGQLWVI